MVEELRAVLKERASLDVEDGQNEALEKCWAREVELLSADTTATIAYLDNECTGEEYSWIFEVFEEVADKTKSAAFIMALYRLAKKYPEITQEYDIDESIEFAKGNVFDEEED